MPTLTIPGGASVPIPRWAVQLLGVVAVVAIAFGVYRHFYPVEPELITVQQANHTLRLEVSHYNLHVFDTPTVTLEESANALRVQAYADGCLLIRRTFAGATSTRLLIDPSRIDATLAASEPAPPHSLLPTVYAAEQPGKCLNPHPGEFVSRYGEKSKADACWVEVWRKWQDACEHVQMFNTCSNSWDSNPDGSPRVKWVRCVH